MAVIFSSITSGERSVFSISLNIARNFDLVSAITGILPTGQIPISFEDKYA
jgi:hypothetical protein